MNKNKNFDFSVLMSVYKNDIAEYVEQAIESIMNQTMKATEIVIVIDGPVSKDIENVLIKYQSLNNNLKLVRLMKNVGLGNALREGLKECSYELIARMDSDDICMPNRFEKQINCFIQNSNVGVVGTNVSEFIGELHNIVSYKKVPSNDVDIKKYMKTRNPFNHMSVMFKKSEVEKAGSYMDWHLNEDYYLWIRMNLSNCNFYNLNETLVNVRINEDTFLRRGGWRYFWLQKLIFDYMLKNRMINIFEYFYNNAVRFIARVLLPNKIRQFMYLKFLRE
ncbi:glycosyltransferase [Paenibacillus sp. L3-i20]|uniref:glycosyltransferase n=1 Tax=Paenibacillus sp. L3-i20 TaxID=2905833 RepID=UPI001EDE578B|nr:glycosyltransferase [Paenibacillus sp. L3-i20]GKU77027.1 glycosyl transferase [Paenibacillus sp. L3-i20]